jgi:hypothetical protein
MVARWLAEISTKRYDRYKARIAPVWFYVIAIDAWGVVGFGAWSNLWLGPWIYLKQDADGIFGLDSHAAAPMPGAVVTIVFTMSAQI